MAGAGDGILWCSLAARNDCFADKLPWPFCDGCLSGCGGRVSLSAGLAAVVFTTRVDATFALFGRGMAMIEVTVSGWVQELYV
jgi:hypothetical protein